MSNRIYYDRLVDVKIIKHTPAGGMSFWGIPSQDIEPDKWYAVYNKNIDKYIVTDNIINSGLNGEYAETQVIGYAEKMDYIMFVIYEHQVSLGKRFTVLDEIKLMKREQQTQINNQEWNWNKKKIELKNKYVEEYPYGIFGIEYYEREDDHY